MARKPILLFACFLAFPALAQNFVTKGDSVSYSPPDRTIIQVTTTAVPIHLAGAMPGFGQVPKEVVPGPDGIETGATARPEPIHVSVEAFPVELGSTLPTTPKETTGDHSLSNRPGVLIVAPPISVVHVGTLSIPPRPEAPSE